MEKTDILLYPERRAYFDARRQVWLGVENAPVMLTQARQRLGLLALCQRDPTLQQRHIDGPAGLERAVVLCPVRERTHCRANARQDGSGPAQGQVVGWPADPGLRRGRADEEARMPSIWAS